MVDQNEFGVKDMLILLNNKVDKVLDDLGQKASQVEMMKVRDRLHTLEGNNAVLTGLLELAKENKNGIRELSFRIDEVETNQVSSDKVDAALAKQRQEHRTLLFQVCGVIGSLGLINIVINIVQGMGG